MKSLHNAGLLLAVTLISLLPLASCTAAGQATARSPLARLSATGKAGPFPAARVTVTSTGSEEGGGFSAVLDTGTGKAIPLAGPDDPSDFFIVEPRSILFMPLAPGGENGIVIFYNSSRIGPNNGTDHKALVYRIVPTDAVRVRAVEARLEGVTTIAAARAKLKVRQ